MDHTCKKYRSIAIGQSGKAVSRQSVDQSLRNRFLLLEDPHGLAALKCLCLVRLPELLGCRYVPGIRLNIFMELALYGLNPAAKFYSSEKF